jgi:hypothetical protein
MHSITCKKHPIFGAFTGSKGIRENYLEYRGRPRKFIQSLGGQGKKSCFVEKQLNSPLPILMTIP